MLYTLTTNPAIDMNISTQGIYPGVVNRTFDTVYTPNGKGLNVSFVLDHFGVASKILGFFGGFSGDYIINESRKKGVEVLPIMVEDTTRINIFLNDGRQEFKLVNEGSLVTAKKQAEMLSLLKGLDDLEYLSISGSLPKGIEPEYYERILQICKEKKVKVILDISSPKLKELLKYHPYLIKPNDEEVREIFGVTVQDEKDMINVLNLLHREGAQNILLTLGDRGSYFFNGTDIYYASAQPVELLSSACAGDSALAAFMSVWLENPDHVEKALKRSAATGANVAESSAIGDLKKVDEYMKNIIVRKVV